MLNFIAILLLRREVLIRISVFHENKSMNNGEDNSLTFDEDCCNCLICNAIYIQAGLVIMFFTKRNGWER